MYGTPWSGKHQLDSNISAPVQGIAFLSRAEDNRIERISEKEAFPLILQSVYRPFDEKAYRRTIELVDELVKCVPMYRLFCNMREEAAVLSSHAMLNETEE